MSLFSFLLGRWQTDGAFAIYPPPPISFKFLLLTSALEEACRGGLLVVDFHQHYSVFAVELNLAFLLNLAERSVKAK